VTTASAPYSRTTLVIVTPRYVVTNNLTRRVLVKSTLPNATKLDLAPGNEEHNRLEMHFDKSEKHHVTFRILDGGGSVEEQEHWVKEFNADEADDFQVAVGAAEKIGEDWSEPCERTNQRKIVRVIVIET
jgi:hypothetical protein